jgi:hypothetical protein
MLPEPTFLTFKQKVNTTNKRNKESKMVDIVHLYFTEHENT